MIFFRFAALLFFLVLTAPGCARMIGVYHDAPYDKGSRESAKKILDSVLSANPSPEAFKGIGNVKLITGDTVRSGRFAWAAAKPDKIRMELLTPYGQPAVTFACDGKRFYLVLHGEKEYHDGKVTDSSLERLLTISISPEHAVSLLGGRPPVLEYSFISLVKSEFARGPVLVLQEKWWGDYEKIYVSENLGRIQGVEVYNSAGELKYKAVFSAMKQFKGYNLPSRLIVSNGEGAQLQLNIGRFWPDVEIAPSTFVPGPPGG